jgi:hypothetical protein
MKITTQKILPFYSGNYALDCPPTLGNWVGEIFTAADGSKWTVDPSDSCPHPCEDGTGTHYLLVITDEELIG